MKRCNDSFSQNTGEMFCRECSAALSKKISYRKPWSLVLVVIMIIIMTAGCSKGDVGANDTDADGNSRKVTRETSETNQNNPDSTPTEKPNPDNTPTPTPKDTSNVNSTDTPKPVPLPTDTKKPVKLNTNTPTPIVKPKPTPINPKGGDPTYTPKPVALNTFTPTPIVKPKPTSTPFSDPTNTPLSKPTNTPLSKPTSTPFQDPTFTPPSKSTSTPPSKPTSTPTPTNTPIFKSTPTPTPDPDSYVYISELNKTAEYIEITNPGAVDVDLSGWHILSVRGEQTYYFEKGYSLTAGRSVKIGGYDAADIVHLLWEEGRGIWNNSEDDNAELYDDDNDLVDTWIDWVIQ